MTVSSPIVQMLWSGFQELSARQAKSQEKQRQYEQMSDKQKAVEDEKLRNRKRKMMSREELIQTLPHYAAVIWSRRHPLPVSIEQLAQSLDNPDEGMAKKISWLEEIHSSIKGLEQLTDDQWAWNVMNEADRSTWPADQQKVYYFFDIVGTHPGTFEGPLPPEQLAAERAAQGLTEDIFGEDFTGGASFGGASGFLDIFDVSHWAPRPLA